METAQVGSLQNGAIVMLLEKTDVEMNGYPWFKIGYDDGIIGYQWGGILCGIQEPVGGLFETCTKAPASTVSLDAVPSDDSVQMSPDAKRIATCVETEIAQGKGGTGCIGLISNPCLDQEDNFSTVSMRQCISAEAQIWDARLNANYQTLRDRLTDESHKTALRDAQRAWISFSQKFCGLEYEFYRGTMYLVTGDDCLLDMTARQSLELRALASHPL